MMMRLAARLVLLLCLAALTPGAALGDGDLVAQLPGSVQWKAFESYPGGSQYDSRLGRPVALWRTSITLAEAFAAIEQQTDVRLGFWPAGDQNERVRITAYLNPADLPSLRDLMVQLAWVTDCAFAVQIVPDGATNYYLLSTSIGDGVVERIKAEAEAWEQSQQVASAQVCRQTAERLGDYREALSLSREEAVRRYRGRDDMLLLCLTHPAYRATTELVCSLPQDDLAVLFSGKPICRAWGGWTPKQRELLTVALGFEESWLDKGPLRIWVAGAEHGYLQIHAWIETTDEFPGPHGGTFRRTAVLRDVEMNATETVTLSRAMGEQMTDAQAYELVLSIAQEIAQREVAHQRREAANRLREHVTLSPKCGDRLASVKLTYGSRSRHYLWEIQEAVARASGMHVISDCFAQFERYGTGSLAQLDESFGAAMRERGAMLAEWMTAHRPELEALHEEGKVHPEYERLSTYSLPVSALAWLTATCPPEGNRWRLLESYPDECTGSEWGDAGAFLRFRSVNRDLWRAAMLPENIVASIDARTRETIESVDPGGESVGSASPPWTFADSAELAGRLTRLQAHFGGVQIYEDPTAPGALARQSLRSGLVSTADDDALRFLATFSQAQWQRLFENGVRFAEMTPDQRKSTYFAEMERRVREAVGGDEVGDDAVLTIRGLRADPDPARPEVEPETAVYLLEVRATGKVITMRYFNARAEFPLAEVRRALGERPAILPLAVTLPQEVP